MNIKISITHKDKHQDIEVDYKTDRYQDAQFFIEQIEEYITDTAIFEETEKPDPSQNIEDIQLPFRAVPNFKQAVLNVGRETLLKEIIENYDRDFNDDPDYIHHSLEWLFEWRHAVTYRIQKEVYAFWDLLDKLIKEEIRRLDNA